MKLSNVQISEDTVFTHLWKTAKLLVANTPGRALINSFLWENLCGLQGN